MARGYKTGGRQKGSLDKKTILKLQEAGKTIAEANKSKDVVRAKHALADLTKTAIGFTAHYQQKMIAWEAVPENKDKLPPAELVDRFLDGLNTAIKAAKALAPFQDPTFSAIKVSMSPLDVPEPKLIEGKATKLDIKDPVELARLYATLVRAA